MHIIYLNYIASREEFKSFIPGEKTIRTSLLFSAGIVAGEALMGVIIAVLIVMGLTPQFFMMRLYG